MPVIQTQFHREAPDPKYCERCDKWYNGKGALLDHECRPKRRITRGLTQSVRAPKRKSSNIKPRGSIALDLGGPGPITSKVTTLEKPFKASQKDLVQFFERWLKEDSSSKTPVSTVTADSRKSEDTVTTVGQKGKTRGMEEEEQIAARAALHGSSPRSVSLQDDESEDTDVETSDLSSEESNTSQEGCAGQTVIDLTSTKS